MRNDLRRKATDVFQIKRMKVSISSRCSAIRRTRIRSFKRHVLRQARVRRKCDCRNGRGPFFVGSTQCKNKKGSGAIQFTFRRSWFAERQLGKTRLRETEGDQGGKEGIL